MLEFKCVFFYFIIHNLAEEQTIDSQGEDEAGTLAEEGENQEQLGGKNLYPYHSISQCTIFFKVRQVCLDQEHLRPRWKMQRTWITDMTMN